MATSEAVDPEISEIAEYIATSLRRPIAGPVRAKARQHLLDSIASIVSGSALPAGRAGRRWIDVAYPGGSGPCSILGTRRSSSAIAAAVANGMAAHAGETDDSHAPSLSHPGCAVAPAVLAVGQETLASGADVLRAFIVGYDVGTRVGLAVQSADQGRTRGTWSSHAVVGTFAAGAAAGVLYNFDAAQARHLLSYCAQLASGVTTWLRDNHHVQKAFVFGGMPAMHGVLAASMVRRTGLRRRRRCVRPVAELPRGDEHRT